jgi:Xaa-Pro aminopeptidase
VSERVQRAVAALPEAQTDALLVDSLINVRYLSGFTGTSGLVLVARERLVFVTDFRYVEQAADQVDPAFEQVRAPHDLVETISDLLPPGDPVRLGFDDRHLSVSEHRRLRELLPERVELVEAGGLIERLRAVKDEQEVAAIASATDLADAAFTRVLESGIVGRTEHEVALALENEIRAAGAQRPSFPPIVASGPHGARPHASPREVAIEPDQLVVFDWGAELDGYCSDCTRTVATGDVGAEAREVYQLVLAGQLAGLEALRAGAGGREVDAAARRVIEEGGRGEEFGHGLGHGVGAEVHEAPRLSKRSEDQLEAGNVVTVEPGIYLAGRFGVRIEDLVVVTETGGRILTSLPKELTSVG